MPRKVLSLTPEQREHVKQFLKLQPSGISYDKYCRAHGMTRTDLCQWVTFVKNEQKESK